MDFSQAPPGPQHHPMVWWPAGGRVDFAWTDEQLRLRRGAVEFASARLASGVRERDRDGIFSRELWNACAEFGLHGILTAEAAGGRGEDLLSAVAVLEG